MLYAKAFGGRLEAASSIVRATMSMFCAVISPVRPSEFGFAVQ